MDGILYVQTPTGERIPALTNEAGALVVNATAVIGEDVQIRDSDGNKITSDNGTGNLRVSLRNEAGASILASPDDSSADVLPVKVVNPDGSPFMESPNSASTYVVPVALKDTSGANITGANNDPSNSSVNVKLMSASNKLLGQYGTEDEEPLVIGDMNTAPLVTTDTSGQSDAINSLMVSATPQKTTVSNSFTIASDIAKSEKDGYLGLIASLISTKGVVDSRVYVDIKNITLYNQQLNAGTNSGNIDLYFVIAGSAADSYLTAAAIPDLVDFNVNWTERVGLLKIVPGISPLNVAGVSVYSVDDLKIFALDGAPTNIKVYFASAENTKEFGENWYYNISKEYAIGVTVDLDTL